MDFLVLLLMFEMYLMFIIYFVICTNINSNILEPFWKEMKGISDSRAKCLEIDCVCVGQCHIAHFWAKVALYLLKMHDSVFECILPSGSMHWLTIQASITAACRS